MVDKTPSRKRQLRFFEFCLISGTALAVFGGLNHEPMVVALAGCGAVVSIPPVWVLRTGRHPSWPRSRFDSPNRSLSRARVIIASERDAAPLNNRFKLPFFLVAVVLAALAALYGGLNGEWALVVAGLLASAGAIPAIFVIRSGKNPWWIRSPLDRGPSRTGSQDTRRD